MRTFDSAIWRILSQQCRQLLFVIRQMAEPKVHATDTLFKALYLKKAIVINATFLPPPKLSTLIWKCLFEAVDVKSPFIFSTLSAVSLYN